MFNANFERTCLSKHFGRKLSPESWHCSAVQAAMLALPRSLEDVGALLGLEQQKMKEGKDLIRYFCVPCKPTKINGGRTRNLPCHAPEKWELFKTYCVRDMDVEKAIRQKLRNYPIPEREMEVYRLDQEINDRGVLVDRELVRQAVACDLLYKEAVTKRAYELTGLEKLITVLPDVVKFPKLTADWENALTLVAKGEYSSAEFMSGIAEMVEELVHTYHSISEEQKTIFGTAGGGEVLGKCPKCDGDVVKGKFGTYCKNKCGMNVKKAMGTALTDAQIKSLLEAKKILVKGLKGKKGSYDAYLIPEGIEDFSYMKDGKEIKGSQYKFKMEFPKKKK